MFANPIMAYLHQEDSSVNSILEGSFPLGVGVRTLSLVSSHFVVSLTVFLVDQSILVFLVDQSI